MDQQPHADFFHAREYAVHLLDVRDAGVGVRGRARRIQFHAMNKAGVFGPVNFLDGRAIGEVQGEQGLEAAARGQRRQDALPIGAGQLRAGDRRS